MRALDGVRERDAATQNASASATASWLASEERIRESAGESSVVKKAERRRVTAEDDRARNLAGLEVSDSAAPSDTQSNATERADATIEQS